MKKPQKEESAAKSNWKTQLKKFWHYVWHGESAGSWIASIILAFIVIRFIFYPLLGIVIGTSIPIVAVISSSMEHTSSDWQQNPAYCSQGYCIQEEWYIEQGISPAEFDGFPFKRGFNKGDIMIIAGKKPSKIEVGDVIVFQAGKNYPIIHRVVDIETAADGTLYFSTKGDNNPAQIITRDLDETRISEERVQGVAKARVPLLGYIKIGATNLIYSVRNIFI